MFQLISVTRLEMEICTSFYNTRKEAHQAMIDDIILSTDYNNLEEIIEAANAGLCGFSDDEAWAETNQFGTGQWNIIEIPTSLPQEERTKADKQFNKLKRELFAQGQEAIEDFLGFDLSGLEEKDAIESAMDNVYAQMPDDVFDKYIEQYNIQEYTVAFAVDARYYANVYATSAKDAKEEGTYAYQEADIGELENIDAKYVHTESPDGNIIDEC